MNLDDLKHDDSKVYVCSRKSQQNPFYHMINNTAFMVTKIYKNSFLKDNNLWFKEGLTHYEDGLFNWLVFARVNKIVQDDNPFYCYRINRPGSAVTEFNAKKVLTASTTVSQEIVNNFDLFNKFNGGSEWVVDKILDINYKYITESTKSEDDRKYYAKIVVDLIQNQLVNQKGISLNEGQKQKLEDLVKIAEN